MVDHGLVQIYVALLDEGTDVWRPVQAKSLHGDVYRIVSENTDRQDEHWEFSTGELVRCVPKAFCGGKR
jgi:hypothetical protein